MPPFIKVTGGFSIYGFTWQAMETLAAKMLLLTAAVKNVLGSNTSLRYIFTMCLKVANFFYYTPLIPPKYQFHFLEFSLMFFFRFPNFFWSLTFPEYLIRCGMISLTRHLQFGKVYPGKLKGDLDPGVLWGIWLVTACFYIICESNWENSFHYQKKSSTFQYFGTNSTFC